MENGKAITLKKTFSRETSVSIAIQSAPEIIWKLLTTAGDYPRWNPTVLSIEGTIDSGEKIKLRSCLDPKRVFMLRVKEVEIGKTLAWGDGLGTRVYTLNGTGNGITTFGMKEKIGGLMFPLFASQIPSFDSSFEQFAAALKKEAEAIKYVSK